MTHDKFDHTVELPDTEAGPEILEGRDGTFAVQVPISIVAAFGKLPNYDPDKHSGGHIMVPGLSSHELAEGVAMGIMVAYAMTRISKYSDMPPMTKAKH